jgi:phosphodiesterase/alkaline phosphatase D-like protein
VRRHAKATSAGSTSGSGGSRALFDRVFATRGASNEAKGSGAPSQMFGLFAGLITLLLIALLPASASAVNYELSEAHPSFCSGSGVVGGECGELKGVAVDQSTGHVYVVDQGNNRVDEFAPDGTFVRAFGADVVLSGQHNNGTTNPEVCEPANSSPTDVCKAGVTTATIPGAFGTGARGIAVDPVSHVVYVTVAAARLTYYDGSSTVHSGNTSNFLGQTEGTASAAPSVNVGAPEKFAASTGLALDGSDPLHRYLYVAINVNTSAKTLIDKFEVSGSGLTATSYKCQITGTASDTSVNHTECGNPIPGTTNNNDAHKDGVFEGLAIGGSSNVNGTTGSQVGGNLAVDANGNVFVAEKVGAESPTPTRHVVSEFNSSGNFVTQFKPSGGSPPLSATQPRPEALALLANGNLLVADGGPVATAGGTRVQQYDATTIAPAEPPASAVPIYEFGFETIGGASGGSLGLAVDTSGLPASNGHIYVADKINKKIWNYEVGIPGPPRIKEQESANVSPVTAEVKAKVHTGNANLTDCHFEYVTQAAFTSDSAIPGHDGFTDLSSGGSKPCVETVANDAQYHPVHADLDSLTPSTQYRWRTVATNAVPPMTKGTAETFTTGAASAPTIDAMSLGALSPTTAEVKATINPHFSEVNAANSHFFGRKDCRFEYTTDPAFHDGIQATSCETPSNLGKGGVGVPTKSILTGLTPNTTYYWRVYAANAIGWVEGTPPLSFTTWVKPATVITDPVGAIGETTAVLNGRVDNQGAPLGSTCEFQVALKVDTTFSSPVWTGPCTPNPVTGSGNVAVSASATGLAKNTEYIYRVRAKNQGNEQACGASCFTNGAPVSFATSEAPSIVQGVISVGETKATLGAFINPNGLATTYHLEYVDDATFQADQPEGFEHAIKTTESASIGSDHTSHEVSVQIEELTKETTYHYRFVAHNANGTTKAPPRLFVTPGPIEHPCANETLREENASLALPECRAYEMVSPADKNFGSVDESQQPSVSVAWDGEGLAFCSTAQFGDPPPENGSLCNANYLSRRTAEGWRTRGMVPNYCPRDLNDPNDQSNVATQVYPSPNFDFAAILRPETASCTVYPALVAHSSEPGKYLYREDLRSDPTAYDLLTPEPAFAPAYAKPTGQYAAASDDFSRIVYESTGNQMNDPATPAGVNRLFEWHNDTLSLVSIDPSDHAFATPSVIPLHPTSSPGAANAANAVSADGSRIFFQNPAGGIECAATDCELYLREGDSTTYWVSEQECSPACPNTSAADKFNGATPGGSKALFRSAAKLNNEDTSTVGEDLYMFTKGPNPAGEQNLTLLSKDNEPADGNAAEVRGVIGIADDGNTVYFAARGQIVAGQPIAAGTKVYRWQWNNGASPSVEYLATLRTTPNGAATTQDEQNWSAAEGKGTQIGMPVSLQVTPNGADLLIQTVKPLDPFADRDSDRDVYRWSAQEGWTCLSCQAPGAASAGESTIDINTAEHLPEQVRFRMGNELIHPMSIDGSRVFFGTTDALVPQDTNHLEDVYQWHDGTLSLISTGAGAKPAALVGASRSGKDVFFVTSQPLLGSDTDGAADFYDARIEGGFPPPPPPPPPCEEGTCPGEGTHPPAPSPAATASHEGAGNPPVKRCKKGLVLKHGKCVAKKHKKHHKRPARRASHSRRAAQ